MERKDFTLDDIADALSFLDESNRDTWIQMGMAIRSEFGDDGFSVWDNWSSGFAKYDKKVVRSTWKSFRKRGISLGTLVKLAISAGWKPLELDDATRSELAKTAAIRREKAAEQMARDEQNSLKLAVAVGHTARDLFDLLLDEGKSKYLARKKVASFGLKFVQQGVIIETNEDTCQVRLITGADEINAYFKTAPKRDDGPISFKYLKPGAVVMPLRDCDGIIWNVQIIFESGRKSFLKGGIKSGLFHLIDGDAQTMAIDNVVVEVEGYATGASIRMATDWPVLVALDAGNLPNVAPVMARLYPDHTYIVAADNDHQTEGNPGVTKAFEAAELIGGIVAVPALQGAV